MNTANAGSDSPPGGFPQTPGIFRFEPAAWNAEQASPTAGAERSGCTKTPDFSVQSPRRKASRSYHAIGPTRQMPGFQGQSPRCSTHLLGRCWPRGQRYSKPKPDRASVADPARRSAAQVDRHGSGGSHSRPIGRPDAPSPQAWAASSGTGPCWVTRQTDCHSAGSKSTSQSRSGQLRPKRHSSKTRHATIQYNARQGNSRSRCSNRRSSMRHPDFHVRNSTSIIQRTL